MTEKRSMTKGTWLLAFACGAAAGTVTAMMTAPYSGKQTRQKLQGWAKDMSRKAERLPKMMGESVDRMARAGTATLTDTYQRTPRTTS